MPGERVRITMPRSAALIGSVASSTDSTITLAAANYPITVRRSEIQVLERSLGKHPNIAAVVISGIIGAGIGGIVGCAANADSYGVFCGGQNDTKVVVGAGVGAITAAVIGGKMFTKEKWSRIAFLIR